MSDQVLFDVGDDGIARVTLNRPEKLNALSPEMVVRLADAWEAIGADPGIRVALLTAEGDRSFCAGGDLGTTIPIMMGTREPQDEWEERLAADRKLLWRAVLRTADFFTPVVAAVHAPAFAGGLEMLLATDIRVAASDVTFALTEVRRGLIAGGGSLARLPRQLSWADAMEVALVAEPIDAQHALRIGLVNRVVAHADVLPVARRFAEAICQGAPIALAKTKEAMVRGSGESLYEAFRIETRCTKDNAVTEDAREGPRAFMEKRRPKFTGR